MTIWDEKDGGYKPGPPSGSPYKFLVRGLYATHGVGDQDAFCMVSWIIGRSRSSPSLTQKSFIGRRCEAPGEAAGTA